MHTRLALGLPALILAGLLSAAAHAVAPLPAPKPLQAPPANATETASGMAYVVLKAGKDQGRQAEGQARVHAETPERGRERKARF